MKDDKMESLKNEILSVQIKRLLDKFKEYDNDSKKKLIKKVILFVPTIITIILAVTFREIWSFVLFCVDLLGVMAYSEYQNNKEIRELEKGLNLLDKFEIKDHTEFIKEKTKVKILNSNETKLPEDIIKYNEALEIQQKKNTKLSVSDNLENMNILREEINDEIANEIDLFCKLYTVPPINVSNKDWDMFLDCIYEYLLSLKLEDRYYNVLSSIVRTTLSESIVFKPDEIIIDDFINNLSEVCKYESIDIDVSIMDALKEKIMEHVNKEKILTFNRKDNKNN